MLAAVALAGGASPCAVGGAIRKPHSLQNFATSGLGAPHEGQNTRGTVLNSARVRNAAVYASTVDAVAELLQGGRRGTVTARCDDGGLGWCPVRRTGTSCVICTAGTIVAMVGVMGVMGAGFDTTGAGTSATGGCRTICLVTWPCWR